MANPWFECTKWVTPKELLLRRMRDIIRMEILRRQYRLVSEEFEKYKVRIAMRKTD